MAKNRFLENVKELRSDISDWVVHFTKGTAEQAEQRIATILHQGRLRWSGDPQVICFSEAPLRELSKLFKLYAGYRDPRFAPYGIAVPKAWLFASGGRPVIYGLAAEREALPEPMRYRHVDYNPDGYDFTWQREWRIAVPELALEKETTLVVLPNDESAFGLTCDVEVHAEYAGGGEFDTEYYFLHDWYSISLTDVEKQETHPDAIFAKSVREQDLREPRRAS